MSRRSNATTEPCHDCPFRADHEGRLACDCCGSTEHALDSLDDGEVWGCHNDPNRYKSFTFKRVPPCRGLMLHLKGKGSSKLGVPIKSRKDLIREEWI